MPSVQVVVTTEGPATQVKNLTASQVAVKVSKYISCFCSQNSLRNYFNVNQVSETVKVCLHLVLGVLLLGVLAMNLDVA